MPMWVLRGLCHGARSHPWHVGAVGARRARRDRQTISRSSSSAAICAAISPAPLLTTVTGIVALGCGVPVAAWEGKLGGPYTDRLDRDKVGFVELGCTFRALRRPSTGEQDREKTSTRGWRHYFYFPSVCPPAPMS